MQKISSFEVFQEKHLTLFRQWLNADHVKTFWQETDDDEKLKEKFLKQLPLRGVHPYYCDQQRFEGGYRTKR